MPSGKAGLPAALAVIRSASSRMFCENPMNWGTLWLWMFLIRSATASTENRSRYL